MSSLPSLASTPPAQAVDRRWTALVVLCAGMLMIILDQTIVNVALPAIQAELAAPVRTAQWVVNAYMLMLGALILVGGAAGDRFGRRRVFVIGITVFTVASVAGHWWVLLDDVFSVDGRAWLRHGCERGAAPLGGRRPDD